VFVMRTGTRGNMIEWSLTSRFGRLAEKPVALRVLLHILLFILK
jgi:hypothetical protein